MSSPSAVGILATLLLLTRPLHAADSLSVGAGSFSRNWATIRNSSRLLSVDRDSIWLWDVEPGGNLATGIEGRGGLLRLLTGTAEEGRVAHDGDPATALDPDAFAGVDRTTPIFVDLGGAFRIDRIRIFPRLDRVNKHRFLQEFRLSTRLGEDDSFAGLFSYISASPNPEPVIDRRFDSRDVRYLQLEPTANREWEIAELEIYGDGSVPEGEFLSNVTSVSRIAPLWGKVRYEGGDITGAPVTVQTRTGPDPSPVFYYMLRGDELVSVDLAAWSNALPGLQGPTRVNPAWSPWESLDEGTVRSPSPNEYIQFRVQISEPGASLKQLFFEYTYPPLARELLAELNPRTVVGGTDTTFTLSLEIRLRTTPSGGDPADTGFRRLQVLTAATVDQVERVFVDDREVAFTWASEPGGFSVDLWRRVVQNGSFVQVVFRGAVFRDRTRFEIRAIDRRTTDQGIETAYQLAREADVETSSPGGGLTVGLQQQASKEVPLISLVEALPLFTPNGDGVNDIWRIDYALLKLVQPASVSVEIRDLSGRTVQRLFAGPLSAGRYRQTWDGRTAEGVQISPGLYLYELKVDSDQGTRTERGVVGVAY